MDEAQKQPDRLVREAERRAISGISRATAWRLERRGKFPARRQITENTVGWSLNELSAWVEARPLAIGRPVCPPVAA